MVPQSIRQSMKAVEISLSSEVFLCRLFGRPMAYIHGVKNEKKWKKITRRILSILTKAIQKNFHSDGFHKFCVNQYLWQLEKACKSRENTDIEIILSLTGMVLELLGGVPNYTGRKALNRKDDYLLSGFRELHFSQTLYQKVWTIVEAARYRPYYDHHKSEDLFQRYVTEYNGDPEGFLDWYKKEYPEVYSQIFRKFLSLVWRYSK